MKFTHQNRDIPVLYQYMKHWNKCLGFGEQPSLFVIFSWISGWVSDDANAFIYVLSHQILNLFLSSKSCYYLYSHTSASMLEIILFLKKSLRIVVIIFTLRDQRWSQQTNFRDEDVIDIKWSIYYFQNFQDFNKNVLWVQFSLCIPFPW